jgi:hypothetical protein
MPSYDDPRFLQLVIEKLQKDVADLKKATLPVLAHQRGPTPGWLNAGQLGPGPITKSAMHLHLDGNQAGVAPRQTVTDAAGTVRYEAGNLAANGISAAHYGWRVNDANGVPIADAIGLSQVMKQLGRGDIPGGPAPSFSTTTPTVISGMSITFSLVRAARVLALLMTVETMTTNGGPVGEIDIYVDGVNIPTSTAADNADSTTWTQNSQLTSFMTSYSASLAAGSHTIEPRAYVRQTVQTLTVNGGTIFVYLLGT